MFPLPCAKNVRACFLSQNMKKVCMKMLLFEMKKFAGFLLFSSEPVYLDNEVETWWIV